MWVKRYCYDKLRLTCPVMYGLYIINETNAREEDE